LCIGNDAAGRPFDQGRLFAEFLRAMQDKRCKRSFGDLDVWIWALDNHQVVWFRGSDYLSFSVCHLNTFPFEVQPNQKMTNDERKMLHTLAG
jgi:hypothetical protein